MAVVTERPLVPTAWPPVSPRCGRRRHRVWSAALPAIALAIGSLLGRLGAELGRGGAGDPRAAVGRRGDGADRPPGPDPARPAGARRRDRRRGGRDGQRPRDPSLPDRCGRAGRRPRHPHGRRAAARRRPALPPRPAQRAPGHAGAPPRRHRHVPHLGRGRGGPAGQPGPGDHLAGDPAVADRLRLRAGRRARPLRVGRRHRPPAHAVGGLGARGRRRGRARRHRAERADEPSGPPRGVGGRGDRASCRSR